MNVVFGRENLATIGDKYESFELDTVCRQPDEPVTLFAIASPDDMKLENIIRLKQFLPVHESLMENYKEQNFAFCISAIGHLRGNINDFMDTYYDNLMEKILDQEREEDPEWTPIVYTTEMSGK